MPYWVDEFGLNDNVRSGPQNDFWSQSGPSDNLEICCCGRGFT